MQVRDFAFSPDSGQITHLSYDSLGLPTVPEALLNVYEVDMESVLELRAGLVVMRRGAERSTILVSSGILGYAFEKVQVCQGLKKCFTRALPGCPSTSVLVPV